MWLNWLCTQHTQRVLQIATCCTQASPTIGKNKLFGHQRIPTCQSLNLYYVYLYQNVLGGLEWYVPIQKDQRVPTDNHLFGRCKHGSDLAIGLCIQVFCLACTVSSKAHTDWFRRESVQYEPVFKNKLLFLDWSDAIFAMDVRPLWSSQDIFLPLWSELNPWPPS